MSDHAVEVIKNFTRARKFPQLIGRTPDGKRILGGPYTFPQVIGGGVVGGVLWLLKPLWLGGVVWNVSFAGSAILVTVFVLGKLRLGGRSPASVLQGGAKAATVSPEPKINGRRIKVRAPHLVRAGGYVTVTPERVVALRRAQIPAVVIDDPTPAAPPASQPSQPTKPVRPAAVPTPTARPAAARSSVKELLALAAASSE